MWRAWANPYDEQKFHRPSETPYPQERAYKSEDHGKDSVIIQECLHTGESTLEKSPLNVVKSGDAFSSNRNLIKQKRTHSGEKPYAGNECGNCFVLKKSLIGHQRICTGRILQGQWLWENLQLPLKPDSPLEDPHWAEAL